MLAYSKHRRLHEQVKLLSAKAETRAEVIRRVVSFLSGALLSACIVLAYGVANYIDDHGPFIALLFSKA